MQAHRVQALLMGGQACVLYGGAEFSRDTDLALLASAENLERLRRALEDLMAEPIAIPPLSEDSLRKGHAVHFRCRHPEVDGLRVDLMSVLRGVDPFEALWTRRTTVEIGEGEAYDLLSLPDLVRSKKTQRDKDWPMIRRLLEAHYLEYRSGGTVEQTVFWLHELRTPVLLIELAENQPAQATAAVSNRPLIAAVLARDEAAVEVGLAEEERLEREEDRAYWRPLREELQRLRRERGQIRR